MLIKANEIAKYMEIHNVDKVPVEVLLTDVPENKGLKQKARRLAKRLIITSAHNGHFDKYGPGERHAGKTGGTIEATSISYVMYNSFKKSKCYLPQGWEMEVIYGEFGEKMLAEFADHGGNLEQKFRDTYTKINPEIQEKVKQAAALLEEAAKLSEDHGIPFHLEEEMMDGINYGYFPNSFDSIFGDLRETEEALELVADLTGVYDEGVSNWQDLSDY